MISGFHLEVDEICALLGYYSTFSDIPYRSFGTTYPYDLQESKIPRRNSIRKARIS
jgi:hypothetical protein